MTNKEAKVALKLVFDHKNTNHQWLLENVDLADPFCIEKYIHYYLADQWPEAEKTIRADLCSWKWYRDEFSFEDTA